MRLWKKKSFNRSFDLSPDEIFLDQSNMPGYTRERLEGVIERPISRGSYFLFASFLVVFCLVLLTRSAWLQIVRGNELKGRSESNYIEKTYLEPPRGIIYDRNGNTIVLNEAVKDSKGDIKYVRKPRDPFAFSHLLGFIGKISEEDQKRGSNIEGISEIGKGGIEKQYDDKLRGIPGEQDQELDARGNVISEGLVRNSRAGENISLEIDAPLQEVVYRALDETVTERGFRGGAAIIFNIKTGAVLSLVSAPSFDLNMFSRSIDPEEAKKIFSDLRSPFYNRAVSGAFAPGSIVKPFIAMAALEEGTIDPNKQIFSSGALSVPDPYHPGKFSVFLDWKAHGYVDMRRAIAVSSNVYFFTVGGGFGDVKGLGIQKIKSWLHFFGLDTPTGIDLAGEASGFLPDPAWKEKAKPDNPTWRIGDTYNTSIGQGDVLVTPFEMARALGMLATRGKIVTPHILKTDKVDIKDSSPLKDENYQIVAEGMKKAAEAGGTASGISWAPFPVGAKTGTAEIGKKDRVNSWFMGYMPYDNPTFGMVVLMESGPRANLVGATYVASETFRWLVDRGGLDYLGKTSN